MYLAVPEPHHMTVKIARCYITYGIENDEKIIWIVDESGNEGSYLSVTNGIEGVIEGICKEHNYDPNSWNFMYRDTYKRWDAFNYRNKAFISLGQRFFDDAIKIFIEHISHGF